MSSVILSNVLARRAAWSIAAGMIVVASLSLCAEEGELPPRELQFQIKIYRGNPSDPEKATCLSCPTVSVAEEQFACAYGSGTEEYPPKSFLNLPIFTDPSQPPPSSRREDVDAGYSIYLRPRKIENGSVKLDIQLRYGKYVDAPTGDLALEFYGRRMMKTVALGDSLTMTTPSLADGTRVWATVRVNERYADREQPMETKLKPEPLPTNR